MEYKGNTVVLDAYNANPTSTKAAIDTFLTLDNRPKMVILGDMFELGDQSLHFHQQVVDLLSTANIEKVILVGKHYGATKMPPGFLHFETTSEAAEWFSHQRFSGYDILVKGSRGVHLEVLFN